MKMTTLQKQQQNAGSRFGRTIPAYAYNPHKKSPSRRDVRRMIRKENREFTIKARNSGVRLGL